MDVGDAVTVAAREALGATPGNPLVDITGTSSSPFAKYVAANTLNPNLMLAPLNQSDRAFINVNGETDRSCRIAVRSMCNLKPNLCLFSFSAMYSP